MSLYWNHTTPIDPKFHAGMLGGDMWCLETLENSTAIAALSHSSSVAIFLSVPLLHFVSQGTTANKEAAIDALRPGESKRRL
jgi:hypothetical protein